MYPILILPVAGRSKVLRRMRCRLQCRRMRRSSETGISTARDHRSEGIRLISVNGYFRSATTAKYFRHFGILSTGVFARRRRMQRVKYVPSAFLCQRFRGRADFGRKSSLMVRVYLHGKISFLAAILTRRSMRKFVFPQTAILRYEALMC